MKRFAPLLAVLMLLFPLRVRAADSLRLQTPEGVIELDTEDYLAGALAAEMPANFPPEALRAQAVAIRSYVAASAPRHADADVCTDCACCLAWHSDEELRALWGDSYYVNLSVIESAVRDTEGLYLAYGDGPALAVFHAASFGCTESASELWAPLPYLVSVESPESTETLPALKRDVFVSYAALSAALGAAPPLITALETDGAGRLHALSFGDMTVSGAELRQSLGLASTAVSVAPVCGGYVFSVRGSGHGVGMSQYGAAIYAAQGMDFRQILAHYYPGTEIRAM